MNETQQLSFIAARDLQSFAMDMANADVKNLVNDIADFGIGGLDKIANAMGTGMDALTPTVTTASITTPIQFLQNWLPGFVKVQTAARKIDDLVGIMTAGTWADEEIVQGMMEVTGTSVPYGDYTNTPLASWNVNFERRTIVRFEEGMRVGSLEEARASKIKANSAEGKREGAALALEIQRNRVGFYGYNSGLNRTYGFLNDPAIPAYTTVATGVGGYLWSQKTFLEIVADINTAVATLQNQSQDLIDPETVDITLAVATVARQYLNKVSDFGVSVKEWITKTYPKMRIVSAPELNAANGGANVFYLYAEKLNDNSSDGGATFVQVVPSKFQVLGVQKLTKGYEEAYTNATAGVMCKRPFAVVRKSGI